MIIDINGQRRINYDNVIDEQIVEKNGGSIKIKFTFVNNKFIVLLMSEAEYIDFKQKTSKPLSNTIISLTCSVVELLQG